MEQRNEGGTTYAYIPTRRMKMGRGSEWSANRVVGDNADMDEGDKDETITRADYEGCLLGYGKTNSTMTAYVAIYEE